MGGERGGERGAAAVQEGAHFDCSPHALCSEA